MKEYKLSLEEAAKIIENLGLVIDEGVDPNWEGNEESTDDIFIWLAVDSNGNERMTTLKNGFQRFSPKLWHSKNSLDPEIRKKSFDEQNKICSYDDTQMKDDHWVEIPEDSDMSKWGAYPHWCYLPKGTIKKLIGRELTWDDEPVKYKG